MLLLTIGLVTVLVIISFLIFDKDLFAPPTIVSLTFLFGCFCCYYCDATWELRFSLNSTILIVSGIVATIIGGIIGVCLSNYPRTSHFAFTHEIQEPTLIYVSGIKTAFVIVFQAIAMVLFYMYVRRVSGFSSWFLAVSNYRRMIGASADVNNNLLHMPFLTRNMVEASRLIGAVYAYIIGNNLIASKKKLTINWIPIVLYSITTFIQGSRSNMIRLWLVILVVAYTTQQRKVGWRKNRETKKIIRTIVLSVIAMGVLFAGLREIVGRSSDTDPLFYVAFYAGSPIAVLNQVWESPITKPNIFGQRILFYFNQSTTALFGFPGKYNFYYNFMHSPNGSHIGNAPTAFRPAFVEFGPVWFFLFFVACGALFTNLYCKCRTAKNDKPIDFRLLVYAYIAYTFFMYFYSTFFDFISHLFIKYVIEMLIICRVLVGWQFKQRFRVTFGSNHRGKSHTLE